MRKPLKWILTLLPVAAGSVGTAVYLTTKNSVPILSEQSRDQKNIRVETRFSPLASSQDDKLNLKTEEISAEKTVEKLAEKPAKPKAANKIILPETPKTSLSTENIRKSSESENKTPIPIVFEKPKTEQPKEKPKKLQNSKRQPDFLVFPPKQSPKIENQENKKPSLIKRQEQKVEPTTKKVIAIAKKIDKTNITPEPKQPQNISKIIQVPQIKTPESKTPEAIKTKEKSEPKKEKEEVEQIQKPSENLGNFEQISPESPVIKQVAPVVVLSPNPPENPIVPEQKKQEEPIEPSPPVAIPEPEKIKEPEIETPKQIQMVPNEESVEEKQLELPPEIEKIPPIQEQKESKNQEINSSPLESIESEKPKTNKEIGEKLVVDVLQELPKINYSYQLESKFKFENSEQFNAFLGKAKLPENEQQKQNLLSFLITSYSNLNPDLAFHPGVREQWRFEIYSKLNVNTKANVGDLERTITSGGSRG